MSEQAKDATKILNKINNPKDLKSLSLNQMAQLASEIRKKVLEVVSVNGGHVSSNLGVVELTLALHYVFNTPEDKLVWDVGNQSYPHKLITGRREQFATLRKMNGISGFCKITESPYDTFGAGHASTSISAALGIAMARDIKGTQEKVVAIIGDGAMTGGLAYEALNNAGALKTNMIVILNSNEMSIAPNVGAISQYVNEVITNPLYNKVKMDLEHLVDKIPGIGHRMVETAHKVEESIKGLLVPGTIFEALGFRYFGPVDGHDLDRLIHILNHIKDLPGPVLFHVVTKKGRGYPPAEQKPDQFHGMAPFDLATGKPLKESKGKSFSSAFGDALSECAEKDPRVVAITAAMPAGTGLSGFAKRFPHRFFDVGIAEEHSVTFAAGLAASGLRPVVALYSTFLQRGYDHLIHDVCIQNLPVIFGIDRAGVVGEDGPTHQGVFDISYLRPVPNLKIVQPRNEATLQAFLKWALREEGPVAIRYPRGNVRDSEGDTQYRDLGEGRAEVLRKGKDIALIALGDMVYMSLEITALLEKEGISAEVIDARFIKPLDEVFFHRLSKRMTKWVTLEDHILTGGFGSGILEFIQTEKLHSIELLRLGLPDVFIEQGSRDKVWESFGLSPSLVAERIEKELLNNGVCSEKNLAISG
ncbi:MAG: 1-deoxy-D-xylulose-5-phosphate synthase [Chlamydiae bacterium]|nr:1-deoxy-D-xylulose-5-phosphate synthase [Chlamydiota bacterium]MBI3276146.1 1-deoxy-D-xylulose-5-phosphate synthase [Chlamydiota bacterium]